MFTGGERGWGSTKWVKGVKFLGTKLLVTSTLYCVLKSNRMLDTRNLLFNGSAVSICNPIDCNTPDFPGLHNETYIILQTNRTIFLLLYLLPVNVHVLLPFRQLYHFLLGNWILRQWRTERVSGNYINKKADGFFHIYRQFLLEVQRKERKLGGANVSLAWYHVWVFIYLVIWNTVSSNGPLLANIYRDLYS